MSDGGTRWQGQTGGGSFGIRAVSYLVKNFGASFVYFFMAFAIPFYVFSKNGGRRAVFDFYRNRMGFGRWKAFRSLWGCYYCFGKIVVDKFASYGGATGRYGLEMDEAASAVQKEIHANGDGAIIISAHVGNLEALGTLFSQHDKECFCTVYGGEHEEILKKRAEALKANHIHLIPVGEDTDYLFEINNALDEGGVILMMADRMTEGARGLWCSLFGKETEIPAGAFALSVKMDVPLYTAFVMRTGHCRYKVFWEKVDLQDAASSDKDRMVARAGVFCGRLEEIVRRYPLQWFNFYDFWK